MTEFSAYVCFLVCNEIESWMLISEWMMFIILVYAFVCDYLYEIMLVMLE